MALNLMYITNQSEVAKIADNSGVNRIFIDMECIGKEERQAGMDSVKSHHTISDIYKIKRVVKKAEVIVRVNPIHKAMRSYPSSYDEINAAIDAGADVIMLPMYKTLNEVDEFLKIVNRQARTQLLAETIEACGVMQEVIKINEVDEIHIGLNDLHLALKKKFMFELLADGTVEKICNMIKDSNKKYGFGGIARIGYGMLPAEYVIREHYRLGSTCAILSRAFCNVDKINDMDNVQKLFDNELKRIREIEKIASKMTKDEFEYNKKQVRLIVEKILSGT